MRATAGVLLRFPRAVPSLPQTSHGLGVGIRAALALVSLIAMYGASLKAQIERSADVFCFNDDARIWLYPLERYHDPTLFPKDYLGTYAMAFEGIGYRALYWIFSPFLTAASLGKILPYVLFTLVLAALAIGAARFGGLSCAWVVVALGLSTDLIMRKLGGGLPRSFGFLIIAFGAVALIYGWMGVLAVITGAGAAVYPPAALPCGAALALMLLIVPARDRGTAAAWSLKKRLLVLTATTAVSGALLLATSHSLAQYGRALLPSDAAAYPEIGPRGRFYEGDDRPGYGGFLYGAGTEALQTVLGTGKRWISSSQHEEGPHVHGHSKTRLATAWVILALSALSFASLLPRNATARRLGILLVAAVACHDLARLCVPYLYIPQRYLAYPIPVFVLLMLSAAAASVPIGKALAERRWPRSVLTIVLGIACLLLVGRRGSLKAGLDVEADQERRIYAFIETLPKDTLLSGWPGGIIDNVPYLSKRQVFLSRELDQPFRIGFADTCRQRMSALIDAYLGTEEKDLECLRDTFGVKYLLVDGRHFQGSPPEYFAPFDKWTKRAYDHGISKGFVVPREIRNAGIFAEGPYTLLDLAQIGRTGGDARKLGGPDSQGIRNYGEPGLRLLPTSHAHSRTRTTPRPAIHQRRL